MSYVGNTNTTQAFTAAVDYFSGNGSTVAFTLSRPVASTAQVQVVVNNVPQNPTDAFTVLNNTITFTGAPSSGTNNIYVQYTSPITQVIQPGQGTVGTVQLDIAGGAGTGAAQMPTGTTAQRPTGATGMIRQNTTLGYLETYNGSAWVAVGDQTASYSVDYLVVAGGAGGGSSGGGGGAGGFQSSNMIVDPTSSYTITVGAGGAVDNNGSNSVFASVTSIGGGKGGPNGSPGSSGGSGGGGSYSNTTPGSGTSGQGFSGGYGNYGNGGNTYGAGGGGGAGAAGSNSTGSNGGAGGVGQSSSISGTLTYYAGGGGGMGFSANTPNPGAGGNGGGGNGNSSGGSTNTGGGGGTGNAGGSGIVIIRYLGSQRGTGGTVTSSGGYTIHTFTSSGTYTA